MAGAITISVVGDVRNLVGGLDKAEGRLGTFGNKAGRIVATGLGVAAAAAVGFGVAAVKSASDAQQSYGATEAIFGKYAKSVIATSNKAADAFGLSANQYRESANLLGALFKNQGVSLDQLGAKTKQFVGLGADLSAMYGGTAKDAVEALTSAFKGEFDPLERYGISLKQSQIATEASAEAQAKYGKTLSALTTAQQKAITQQATAKLLMKQTGDAQGQFAAQTNTLAEQQQILGAKVDNLKAKLGTALLPAVTAVVGALSSAVGPVERLAGKVGSVLAPVIDKVGGFLRDNTAYVKPFAIALGGLAAAVGVVTLATAAFSVALNSTGIPLVIIAVAALVAGLVVLYQRSSTVRDIVAKVGDVITTNVLPTLAKFGAFITGTIVPAVVAIATKIGSNLQPIFVALASTFQTQVLPAVQRLAAKFEEWRPTIQRVITLVVKITGKVLEFGAKLLGKLLPPLIKVAGFLAGKLISSTTRAIGIIVRIAGAVISFGTALVNGGKKIAEFAGKVAAQIGRVIKTVTGLPGKILSAIGDLGGLLFDAGKQVIQGLLDGIGSMVDKVKDKLHDITNLIPIHKGPPAKDRRLLRPAGRSIMAGLIDGLKDGTSGVTSYLDKLTKLVVKTYNKAHKKNPLTKKNITALDTALSKVGRTLAGIAKTYATWKNLAGQVTDAARQYAGITSLADFGVGATSGADGIITGLTARLDAIKQFNADIAALAKKGLSKNVIKQLLAAGVEQGTPYAEALLTGGTSAITKVNQLTGQINTATKTLGDKTASLALGFNPASVTKAATKAAGQINKIIRKRTGIRIDVTTGTTARRKVNQAAITTRATNRDQATLIKVKLTAQQTSQLQRGREIALDLKAYQKAGGR